MKKVITFMKLLDANASDLGGVFTYSDLAAICNCSNTTLLPRYIRQLEDADIITRFIRGFYVTKSFDPHILSQRIAPESYLSLETVLSKNLIIGTIPAFRITAIKLGKSKLYQSPIVTIEHLSTSKDTFTGFKEKNGVKEADSEKALIDTLYFYLKGRKPSFDIYSDINISKLDMQMIEQYLKHYKNPKFIKFAKGVLDAYR